MMATPAFSSISQAKAISRTSIGPLNRLARPCKRVLIGSRPPEFRRVESERLRASAAGDAGGHDDAGSDDASPPEQSSDEEPKEKSTGSDVISGLPGGDRLSIPPMAQAIAKAVAGAEVQVRAAQPATEDGNETSGAKSEPAKTKPKSRAKVATTKKRSTKSVKQMAEMVSVGGSVSDSLDELLRLSQEEVPESPIQASPILYVTKPLPKVLVLHTGGTLGMDPESSYESGVEGTQLKPGTGGNYGGLRAGSMLNSLLSIVPELAAFANLDLKVVFNKDSCRVGPEEWIKLAKILDANRNHYDAFLIVHGTDTMSYTASALSLMLLGFRKPIILTGSQLPLMMPRSDARQNLIDSVTCATAMFNPPHITLQEVAICFGGKLMRGNRCQKVNASTYAAFDSPTYTHLADLGVDVEWNEPTLLRDKGVYRPRFKLNPNVIRIPIVPGSDPRVAYGDLYGRGVRGVVLEAFGVGNMPDTKDHGWLPWLKSQRKKGLQIQLASQCRAGALQPELYHSGSVALQLGVEAGPQMTPETSCVKMMMCLEYPDIPLGVALAGEM